MTRKFNIGDRVRITKGRRQGTIATIIAVDVERCPCCAHKMPSAVGCALDIPTLLETGHGRSDCPAVYRPDYLAPYYDGDEPVKWEALADIWQPKSITVC